MNGKIKLIKAQEGYTLIEVMAALSILFIVLIPVTQLIGFLISDTGNIDRINAVMLAEREMETTISTKAYESKYASEKINGREYKIIRRIQQDENIINISIEMSDKNNKIIFKFQNLRLK